MKNRKKKLLALLSVIMIACVVAACAPAAPTPSAGEGFLRVEVEDSLENTSGGTAVLDLDYASGGKAVGNMEQAGASVTVAVQSGADASAEVDVWYTAESGTGIYDVYVDDVRSTTLVFPATSGGFQKKSLKLALKQGGNSIRFVRSGDGSPAVFDCLDIKTTATGEIDLWGNMKFKANAIRSGSIQFVVEDAGENSSNEYVLYRNGTFLKEVRREEIFNESGNDYFDYNFDTNLFSGRAISSSSCFAGYEAEKAIDGDASTRWASDQNVSWLEVDLGATKRLNTVSFSEVFPELQRLKKVVVKALVGEEYRTMGEYVFDGERTGEHLLSFEPVDCTAVRLEITGEYVSISEMSAYLDDELNSTFSLLGRINGQETAVFRELRIADQPDTLELIAKTALPIADNVHSYEIIPRVKSSGGSTLENFAVSWELAGNVGGVSLKNGILTLSPDATEGIITVRASLYAGKVVSDEIQIEIYRPEVSDVWIEQGINLKIPATGSLARTLSAGIVDQKGNVLSGMGNLSFRLAEETKGVSLSGNVLTVNSTAQTGKTKIVAELPGTSLMAEAGLELKRYTYGADGELGVYVENGTEMYNRPVYGSHAKDLEYKDRRTGVLAGDRPAFLFVTMRDMGISKNGHLFFGIENGKWFQDMDYVLATYREGTMRYEIEDASFRGTIVLELVRPVEFDGAFFKLTLPEGFDKRIVTAVGGAWDPTRLVTFSSLEKSFNVSDTLNNSLRIEGTSFRLQNGASIPVYATTDFGMEFTNVSAKNYSTAVDTIFGAKGIGTPMAAGVSAIPGGEGHFIFSTESLDSEHMKEQLSDVEVTYAIAEKYYEDMNRRIYIESENDLLNTSMSTSVLVQDAIWNCTTYTHGTIIWNIPYAGWRVMYGASLAGWSDRIAQEAKSFSGVQVKDGDYKINIPGEAVGISDFGKAKGAIPSIYDVDGYFYNMGENLIDQMLYEYEISGNLGYIAEYYQMVNDFLEWEYVNLARFPNGEQDTSIIMYENKINEWNTDQKWNNGGGGSNATIFNERANRLMYEIATRLAAQTTDSDEQARFSTDADKFLSRADAAKRGLDEIIYDTYTGVFAEYVDILGNQLHHNSPDFSTIAKAVFSGYADMFQAYQSCLYPINSNFPSIKLPGGGTIYKCSNWPPDAWSTHGYYMPETISYMFALFKAGMSDMAYEVLKGQLAGMFDGLMPSAIASMQLETGGAHSEFDFSDPVSLYIRAIFEGLYGINIHANRNEVTVTPSLPTDWKTAAIQNRFVSYQYAYENNVETYRIDASKPYEITLRSPAKGAKIASVTVNGVALGWDIEPGVNQSYITVNFTGSVNKTDVVEIRYGAASGLPQIAHNVFAVKGGQLQLTANGIIEDIYDPQGLLKSKGTFGSVSSNVTLNSWVDGKHTFFVLVKNEDVLSWQAVNIEINDTLKFENGTLRAEGGKLFAEFDLTNCSGDAANLTTAIVGGAEYALNTVLAAQETRSFRFEITNFDFISPGSNRISIDGCEGILTGWDIAEIPEIAERLKGAKSVDISSYFNQSLKDLHAEDKYTGNRPMTYSDTTLLNGRPGWYHTFNFDLVPKTELLDACAGLWKSETGVSFAVNGKGQNSVFTSLYNPFHASETINVNEVGSKIYFLVAMSTNQNQSWVENARITVHLSDGTRHELSLIPPDNMDDWMGINQVESYVQNGRIEKFGSNCHGNLLDIDLGGNVYITSVTLETVANEVLTGILGITVL